MPARGAGAGPAPDDLEDVAATYRVLAAATAARCQARGVLDAAQAAALAQVLGEATDRDLPRRRPEEG